MLDIALLPEEYAVCRLPAGSPVPAGLLNPPADSGVVSVTRTGDELSIICPADQVPADATVQTPWRCLRVAGPLDLALTGILASLVVPLADARVNIVAFSTYDTDYLLVPSVRLAEALEALRQFGHRITT
ncbi:ACT domain-containing protein [Plantactinospora endophytica]|uniref:Amino acid-binding protein n=1 Tax=Plantactinospora endophytica TaxID=673535 RepID=A0ABQ4E3S5_9ACTN|nr:ACT domain-containing protein [Plantactinospora endophytica]GIG88982.1 amino acid-binding protein [Plantactinospora endophytica]